MYHCTVLRVVLKLNKLHKRKEEGKKLDRTAKPIKGKICTANKRLSEGAKRNRLTRLKEAAYEIATEHFFFRIHKQLTQNEKKE